MAASDLTFAIVKRGPLVVSARYTGTIAAGGAMLPFIVTLEMPSSKSWVKLSAAVTDPAKTLRGLQLSTPLALGPLPWVWDFGTSRWTYGQLRNAADRVAFVKSAGASDWTVTTTANGRDQLAEAGNGTTTPFAGWAHLQGGKEVVAFAIENAATHQGGTTIEFTGDGQSRIVMTGTTSLTVYEHFVSVPVQIGAATAPPAILSPLDVRLSR